MPDDNLLLELKDLKTYFYLDDGIVRAADGVSLQINRQKTLGLVGESGCGKSVTALSILNLIPRPPGRIVEGEVLLHRKVSPEKDKVVDLAKLNPMGEEIRSIRGNEIAMIFQEPMTSLSPVHSIGEQIMEVIMLHQKVEREEARKRAIEMLDRVRMPVPEQRVDEYPHELSGGMRQRAMIAMALSCNPSLLMADEPTTALDVTIQAQILDLMKHLQTEFQMSILMITHNLGVIAELSDEVAVMYMGKVVEYADVDRIFYDPKHPYTRALLESIPRIGKEVKDRLESIKGMVPDPFEVPKGCAFYPRCREIKPSLCHPDKEPPLLEVEPGHKVRCCLYI